MTQRPHKNPNTKDSERERVLKRRIMEERARAEETWKFTKPRNKLQRGADYLKGKTRDDHITYRIYKGVIQGLKYGVKYYPQTNEEKYLDIVGNNLVQQVNSHLRRNKRYGFMSIGTKILHENPDTGDKEYVIVDMTTEQPKNSKKKSELLQEWEDDREQLHDTMSLTTEMTVENALRSEAERKRLEREELDRRKRQKENNNESEENKE